MKKEAEARAQTLQNLADEDRVFKEKKQLKKVELRKIMDKDALEKRNFYNHKSQLNQRT